MVVEYLFTFRLKARRLAFLGSHAIVNVSFIMYFFLNYDFLKMNMKVFGHNSFSCIFNPYSDILIKIHKLWDSNMYFSKKTSSLQKVQNYYFTHVELAIGGTFSIKIWDNILDSILA